MYVQATITYKWNAWAKRYLIGEGVLYLTWLIAFQIFVLLFQAGLPFFIFSLKATSNGFSLCVCMV